MRWSLLATLALALFTSTLALPVAELPRTADALLSPDSLAHVLRTEDLLSYPNPSQDPRHEASEATEWEALDVDYLADEEDPPEAEYRHEVDTDGEEEERRYLEDDRSSSSHHSQRQDPTVIHWLANTLDFASPNQDSPPRRPSHEEIVPEVLRAFLNKYSSPPQHPSHPPQHYRPHYHSRQHRLATHLQHFLRSNAFLAALVGVVVFLRVRRRTRGEEEERGVRLEVVEEK